MEERRRRGGGGGRSRFFVAEQNFYAMRPQNETVTETKQEVTETETLKKSR